MNLSSQRISRAVLAVVVGWAGLARAATPFSDYLVQPPKLAAPDRGSVAGSLANLAFEPGSLARGSFGLPLPITLPGGRGQPGISILPSYSPDGAQSEWGMGWRTNLSIQRTSIIGDIDFAGDEFVSPWGRLVAGAEGRYHPIGSAPQIALRRVDGGWEAVTGDGTKLTFAAADNVANGYAWMLSRIDSVLGEQTKISYERNASGRLFATAVEWGGRGEQRQYRIEFEYDTLATPIEDYRAGVLVALDRRIREVRILAKSPDTGSFEFGWSYQLEYTPSPAGVAFFLTGITKIYRSGDQEPTQHYEYDVGSATIAAATLSDIPALDAILASLGNNALLPDKAGVLDVDQDGEMDFEIAKDQTLVRHHGGTFTAEALPGNATSNPLCRPPVNAANLPRTLARMTADTVDPQAIRTTYNSSTGITRFLICDREGTPLSDQQIAGPWPLGPNVHLVDLNHDQRPDLVRLFSRGYQIAENTSGPDGFSFDVHQMDPLTQSFVADSSWVQDMNGDGQADLVMRFSSSVMVWYGLGNFKFTPTGRSLTFKSISGQTVIDVAQRQLTFLDVNRDGLMDVLTTRGQALNLFVNNGRQLREVSVPALVSLGWEFGVPVIADVTGSGDFAVMFLQNLRAKALQLTTASTGLMIAAHDGKGTDVTFSYKRSAAAPGLGQRQVVLDSLTVASSGYDTVSYSYSYGAPVIHTVGKHLIGFASADKQAPLTRYHVEFINDDDISGVATLSEQTDDRTSGVVRFTRNLYDEIEQDGVRWLRPSSAETGHRSTNGDETLSTVTQYVTYERGFCPTVVTTTGPSGQLIHVTTLASVAAVPDDLSCLQRSASLMGVHGDTSLDFRYVVNIDRNAVGQVVQLTQFGATGTPLVLQNIEYDAEYRIRSMGAPGRGTSTVSYDTVGRVARVIGPVGVATEVGLLDPVSDDVLELTSARPDAGHTSYFRYDGRERLQASWDDVSGASSAHPLTSFAYQDPTSTKPGRIDSVELADAITGISRRGVAIVGADGAPMVSGTKLGELYALGPSSISSRTTLTKRSAFVGTVSDATLAAMTSADLRALGTTLEETVESGFGQVVRSTTTYQTNVVGTTTRELILSAGELVTREHEPGGSVAEAAADAAGQLVRKLDENGVTHRYTYDALGRLVHVDTPDGGHTLAFDDFGRPSRITRAGVGSVVYAYDPISGLPIRKQHLDAFGALVDTSETQFDAIGRPFQISQTSAADASELAFSYDGQLNGATVPGQLGRLTQIRGPGWSRSELFDALGRVSEYHVQLDGWRNVTCDKTYRADGSVASDTLTVTGSDGSPKFTTTKETTLDSFGRVHTFAVDGAVLYTLSYDDEGRPRRADFASGEAITFAYDLTTHERSGYELQSPASAGGVAWELEPRGLISAETYTNGNTTTRRSYGYDGRGALLSAAVGANAESYSYTVSGLPDSISDVAGARSVHRTGTQLTVGDVVYTWDTSGRLAGKGPWTLRYGANGQLTRASRAGRQLDFVYDDANRRLLKRIDGTPVRADVAGGVLTNDHFVELITIGGVVAGVLDNGEFAAVLTDARGTPFADADGVANVASTFGVRVANLDVSEVIDYAGLGLDVDLDIVRMGVRDYDARLAQFLTPDPLYLESIERCQASPLQCSLYGYAGGNPISFVDPSGTDTVSPAQIQRTFHSWMAVWSATHDGAQQEMDSIELGLRNSVADVWMADRLDRVRNGQRGALGSRYEAALDRLDAANAQLYDPEHVLSWLEAQGAQGRSPAFAEVSTWAAANARWTALYVQLGMMLITGMSQARGPGAAEGGVDAWAVTQTESSFVARFNSQRSGHIFRNAPGHVNPSSVESQAGFARLFERVASDPANLRLDAVRAGIITPQAANAGVQAFTSEVSTGQVWVAVRNGEIQNAGINLPGNFR